ncbi:MAG: 16S rRNA (uracil(1498)-N(3))-methyltransferase [Paludibacter sp.]|jgi:16S rRNA (uracil1498-N3)-methyltransferase|nr:16S rRNA (uracil(1498)-N(3))-methyltransferase [Paludibacter sp.]
MTLFYVPNLATEHVLPEEESLHAVKVLRLKVGDELVVVDGVGGYHIAKITLPHPKRCAFELIESQFEFGKRDYKLHIAIAPTKNMDRLEWFVEKATEIGIDEITPIICRFSERKMVKAERLEKIIVSAAKQSVKAYFPKLNPQCTFDELIKNHQATQKFIAHCYNSEKRQLKTEIVPAKDILVLIGPEGDFSKDEVEKAIKSGYLPVSLGESRLRTETAGVVACHTVSLMNQ